MPVNVSVTSSAFDLVDGDMVCGRSRLLGIAIQRRERAGSQCPAIVSKELAVDNLVGADSIIVAVQDIEQHDGAVAIRQSHSAARHRDIDFSIVMGELELIAYDFEISRRRGIAVGECRGQK